MAQTGYTPISIYYSSTAAAVPTAGNLVAGELAINTADGKLFYKDSAGVVQVIAGKAGAGVAGGSNTQVQYNSSGSLAGSANMTFDGTTLTTAGLSDSGNLTFTGTGNRITGDFSNATATNRVFFQTSTTNGITAVGAIPNGTAVGTAFWAYNGTPGAAAFGGFNIDSTAFNIQSTQNGSSYLPINIYTGGSVRMTIDSAGFVGIGTQTPLAKFQVKTATNVNAAFTTSGNDSTGIQIYGYNDAGSALIPFWSNGSYLGFSTGSTERMRIDSNGAVCIGTTAPISSSFKANIVGGRAGVAANSEAYALYLQYSSATAGFYLGSPSANTLGFSNAGGSERMRIDENGKLLIGFTTAGTTYTTKFQISTDSGTTKWEIGPYTTSTNFVIAASGSSGGVYLAGTAGTSWLSASDERVKENLAPITDAVNKVASLRALTGTYINDDSKTSHAFLIAQDVLKVLPEAVDTQNPNKYGLAYTEVIPLLVAAIQELNKKVIALEAKVG